VSEGYSGVRVIGGLIVIMGALRSGGCALVSEGWVVLWVSYKRSE
jgi:hypothetical protein